MADESGDQSNLPKLAPIPKIPRWLIFVIMIGTVCSWIPLALIARARTAKSPRQRIHFWQDMDQQPKYKAQSFNPAFADHRSMRSPIENTVAQQGDAKVRIGTPEDDHYRLGYKIGVDGKPIEEVVGGQKRKQFYDTFPAAVTDAKGHINASFLERGRERYNIFCSMCHGHAGYGDGLVHRRVNELTIAQDTRSNMYAGEKIRKMVGAWGVPRNFHLDPQRYKDMPVGEIFTTISDGFNLMKGYKRQIDVDDRWAIAAYVKALVYSRNFEPHGASLLGDERSKALKAILGDALTDKPVVKKALTPVELGAQLWKSKICFTCHQTEKNDTMVRPIKAPSFVGGIFGREEEVHVGIGGPIQKIKVDDAYLLESLSNPMAKIVKGYQPVMPPVPLTDQEKQALLAYIKSLGSAKK